ncbi:MAG TPA: hypothetical protein VJK03_00330 [Candidatus Nanoarchaeia archaeon]|nr:hypothetical protein [Candidatus Nanoarchaeia archaeon]
MERFKYCVRATLYIRYRETMQKTITLTKKIAKHGKQAIIVIPRFLQHTLKPRTLVEIKISILEETTP